MQVAFVNHLFAVVDAETAAAIEQSALLRQSADFSVTRVTADGGRSWKGRYVSMRSTYVELFGPDDADEVMRPGSIGIALGGDRTGVLDEVDGRLQAEGHRTAAKLLRRRIAGEEIDWFRQVGPMDEPDAATKLPTVDIWLMEYLASYMDHAQVGKRSSLGSTDDVSRSRYNEATYRGGLFADLDAALFALPRSVFAERVQPWLTASGFHVATADEDAIALSDETELRFTFVSTGDTGLRALRFRLTRPVPEAKSESIGRSALTVGPGRSACWTFA